MNFQMNILVINLVTRLIRYELVSMVLYQEPKDFQFIETLPLPPAEIREVSARSKDSLRGLNSLPHFKKNALFRCLELHHSRM